MLHLCYTFCVNYAFSIFIGHFNFGYVNGALRTGAVYYLTIISEGPVQRQIYTEMQSQILGLNNHILIIYFLLHRKITTGKLLRMTSVKQTLVNFFGETITTIKKDLALAYGPMLCNRSIIFVHSTGFNYKEIHFSSSNNVKQTIQDIIYSSIYKRKEYN